MAGIADKFDKAYEDKSLAELADAPVAALQGVSDGDLLLFAKRFAALRNRAAT